jgi:hypothetical protein
MGFISQPILEHTAFLLPLSWVLSLDGVPS